MRKIVSTTLGAGRTASSWLTLFSRAGIVAGLCCVATPAAGLAAASGRGMGIESATQDQHAIRVVTNATEFVFHKAGSRILLYQRIPKRRSLGSISGLPLSGMRLVRSDARECEVSGASAAASVKVSSDGLVRIRLPSPVEVTVQGAYEPRYRQHLAQDYFLPDERGGLAMYAISGEAREEPSATWKTGWSVRYRMNKPGELWVAAFPPKPFDWAQSRETMLHSFSCKHPYPSDADLRAWRRFGSVLTLHSWVWRGTAGSQYGVEHDSSWESPDFEPKSAEEFRRVVRTAHMLDMKVIPYMSPYYAAKPTPAGIDKFVASVEKRKQELGFDGVYFDGAFASIASAYEVVLRTRQAIGDDGILHMHLTGVPDMICPFIDCHADYLLRGEHSGLTQDYARWHVSCYNLGNAIGTFCYDRLRVSPGMIELIFSVNARLPFWVDDGTWNGAKYHLIEPEQQLMIRDYYPRLQQQKEGKATPVGPGLKVRREPNPF